MRLHELQWHHADADLLERHRGLLHLSATTREYVLTNAGSYRSHVASFVLSKNFDAGIFTPGGSSYFTFGYAFTDAHDRRNMFNSTAGSNYDLTAAFDRQNPDPVTRLLREPAQHHLLGQLP